jgi:glucoamylase
MLAFHTALVLAAVPAMVGALATPKAGYDPAIDSYFAKELKPAEDGLFANIGPSGEFSSGAAAGVVIASPATLNPDYRKSSVEID